MKPILVDTDIVSLFLRNHPAVVTHFADYVRQHQVINLSIITYYEILSGLLFRDARRQLNAFKRFVATSRVLPLTEAAAEQAARLYAQTRAAGTPVDDIDRLIAGIAIAHGMGVATRNIQHFSKIPGLGVEDWSV